METVDKHFIFSAFYKHLNKYSNFQNQRKLMPQILFPLAFIYIHDEGIEREKEE